MSYHRRTFIPAATPAEIERLLHHMPTVASLAENTWAQGFALSVCKQARRGNLKPSEKQSSVMLGLVSGLLTHDPDPDQGGYIRLIE
jgi:hypothetical protein